LAFSSIGHMIGGGVVTVQFHLMTFITLINKFNWEDKVDNFMK